VSIFDRRVAAAALTFCFLIPTPLPSAAEDEFASMELGMDQAIARALDSNLDVAIARQDPRRSELNVILARSAFDLGLAANLNHQDSAFEPDSNFSATGQQRDYADAGVQGRISSGMTWDATITHADTRVEYPQEALLRFDFVPNTIWSTLGGTLRQPLLRGSGKRANHTEILVSRLNLDISDVRLVQQLLDTVRDVEAAYLDLMTARANLEVQEKSLQRARDLYELNRTKVEVGTLAPIEITTAEAEVAQREEGVITAEAAIRDAEDVLRALMNVEETSMEWEREIVPTYRVQRDPVPVDLEMSIARALDRRSEVLEAKDLVAIRETEVYQAKNGMKSQLDLLASYVSRGNNYDVFQTETPVDSDGDGTPDTIIEGTERVSEGRTGSLAEVFEFVNTNWTVGFEWRYAFGNRAGRADYSKRRIALNEAELGLLKAEQLVRVQVRRAVRAVETDAKRAQASTVNVRLQEKKVEAEQKKYENGMSTSFEVLTFQNDLAAAESGLVSALSDYNKSLTALAHTTGTLLEDRGIEFAPRRYGDEVYIAKNEK